MLGEAQGEILALQRQALADFLLHRMAGLVLGGGNGRRQLALQTAHGPPQPEHREDQHDEREMLQIGFHTPSTGENHAQV